MSLVTRAPDQPVEDPAAKLRQACDMFETGVAMMRQNLRRRSPEASDQAIDDALAAWLRDRPGAEHGDAPGHLLDLARFRQ
jgi:hypothetical protein